MRRLPSGSSRARIPIGQHFGPDKIKYSSMYEIVGVVRDMRYMTYDYKDPIRPMYWLPEAQTTQWDDPAYKSGEIWSLYLYNIVIWAPGKPPGMEDHVRKALASIDPNLVLYGVDPYTEVLSGDFQQENMIATLTTLLRRAWAGAGRGRALRGAWRTRWNSARARSACGWRSAQIVDVS